MAFKVEHRVGAPFSGQQIWDVLSDLPRWKEWNTLYPQIDGLLRIQQRLTIVEAFPGRDKATIRPMVVDWVPNEQILWALGEMMGLVKRIRYIEIEALGETGASSILSNGELYQGLLGNMVGKSRRKWLKRGFEQLNTDIVARVRAVSEGTATADGDRG
jgi:hypothetical protein